MKDKDQKRLEMIYESLTIPFEFIKEEEILAKDLSQKFASTIAKTVKSRKQHLNHLPTSMYNSFWIYLTMFHHDLPDETLQQLKLDPERTKWFNSLYEGYVVREMAKNTLTQKIKGKIHLIFEDPFNSNTENIPADDAFRLTLAFEEYIKLYIQFAFTDKNVIRDIENEIEYVRKAYQWRKQKIRDREITNRLPELDGIF